jgi:hypothetical protein
MNELNWCWSKVTKFRATRMTCLCALLLSRTKASFVLLVGLCLLERFCCRDAFMIIMVFSVVMENTKVVANLLF